MLYATFGVHSKWVASWHIGIPLHGKLPETTEVEVQVDGDELDYVLQFVPHEKIALRKISFYGLDAYRILCGINEDYAPTKVERFNDK